MEELFQKAVKRNEEMKKSPDSVPWKPDHPHPQPYYSYDSSKKSWEPAERKPPPPQANSALGINRLALFSWNIDFMLPFAKERMNAALNHLEGVTRKLPSTTAAVIFLQECLEEDLATVGEKEWVRKKFNVTDVDASNWQSAYYGTTTLVDRRLDITSCFRVHYEKTRMERDALFVDVILGSGQPKTIRLCNTHLESLALEPPFRPAQMQVVAKYMHADGVHGAIVAGDFNAIQPFDRKLHSDNNLRDAYLELGGKEDSDEGYTWGQQAATEFRRRFGCSRMDKVYLTGNLKLHRFERFGVDIQITGKEADEIIALGFDKPWVTDHLGIVAEVEVVDEGGKL
ncbi:Endonuclease/exonuclease/phosphatase [Hypoxylon sp. NC0597]|nr:Endonuclease/exonuclease/phosphatase [Hypoxylon sp. NC0597]